jgi:hypothetical protein
VRAQRRQRDRRARVPGGPPVVPGHPAVIEETLNRLPGGRVYAFETLYDADREAAATASDLVGAYA